MKPEHVALQRAAWEDMCERRAVAAQDAGLPLPVNPDFVPQRFAYLRRLEERRRRPRPSGRLYTATMWRVTDVLGVDLMRPMAGKMRARQQAQDLGFVLLEGPLQAHHIFFLQRFKGHYGTRWKEFLRRTWEGMTLPLDLRDGDQLVEHLRKELGEPWLQFFKLPEQL